MFQVTVLPHLFRLTETPMPLKLKITADLSMPNPAYAKAKQQRRPTWGIEPRLDLYIQDADGSLVLPRGYAKELWARIAECGCEPKVTTFIRTSVDADFGEWNPAFELRGYQQESVEKMVQENGVVVSPAGSGKTIIGLRCIYEMRRPTLWLTHTVDLMRQTVQRAATVLSDVGEIGLLGDRHHSFGDRKLIVATVQTLRADPSLIHELNSFIGLVIVDEAHHFPANQFLDTVGQLQAPRILGITATPDRKDGLQALMYRGIGPLLHRVERVALYEDTQLVKPNVRFVYTDYSEDPASVANGSNVDFGGDDLDYAALLADLIRNDERRALIARTIVDALPQGSAIVIAESVRYCFELQREVLRLMAAQGETLTTAVVHGGLSRYTWRVARSEGDAARQAAQHNTEYKRDPKTRRWMVQVPMYTPEEFAEWQVTSTQRKEIMQRAQDRQIDVLFATQLAREGLDLPHLCVGHMVTPKRGDDRQTHSGAALEQEIGRIMRPDPRNPDKAAYWYDYVDDRVGIFKSQYYSRRKVYKRLGLALPQKPRDAERDLIEDFLGKHL